MAQRVGHEAPGSRLAPLLQGAVARCFP